MIIKRSMDMQIWDDLMMIESQELTEVDIDIDSLTTQKQEE